MTVEFSICIPSYNRSVHLRTLLLSLRSLPLLPSSEVVVVLDGSTDDSKEMLEDLAVDYPAPLRWKWQPNGGLAAARNALVELAQGQAVWFLDDDMTVTVDAFDAHRKCNRSKTDVLFGPSYVVGNEGLALFYEQRWRELALLHKIDDPAVVSFANTSALRSVMKTHRFNETFTGYGFEDYELALRMFEAGLTIDYDATAIVSHHNNKPALEMLQNVRDEGVNRVRLTKLHPESGSFALEMRQHRLAGLLWRAAEAGRTRRLWAAAVVVRLLAKPLGGRRFYRVVRLADDFALHSGIARALGDRSEN